MSLSLSLADQIARELRADIIGGRLLPGMALVEVDLVKGYNASRNTIREALHRLGQEGLTRYVRNKGVMVRRVEREEVRDLFVVRRTLELQAIARSSPLTPLNPSVCKAPLKPSPSPVIVRTGGPWPLTAWCSTSRLSG